MRLCVDVARPRGDTSHDSQIVGRFARRFKTAEWPGQRLPEVWYDPRALALEPRSRASLHAKCIVVDDVRAFVSSANFTEAAIERNIEVGVLLDVPASAAALARHFDGLARTGVLQPLPGFPCGEPGGNGGVA